MNPRRKGRSSYATLFLSPLLSLFLFLNPSFAEQKEFNVKFRRKDYNVSFDEQKFVYKVEPNAEYQVKKEVLASAIIDDSVNEIKKKRQVLEEKIDAFIYGNPSEMDLFTAYKDVDFKIAHESPFNIDSPILDIVAERKGKELGCKVILSSYEKVTKWDKRASVIISYPKDTSIIRFPDKVHEIDVDSTDIYGRYKTREVTFSDEKEVLGIGLELLQERLKQTIEESYGIIGIVSFSPVGLEERSEKNERRRREKKTKSMVRDRNWRQYQPQGDVQSSFEAGRTFSLKFEGKPDRIDFFVNSSLYQNPLNPTKEATTLNNESIMLKVISVFIDEPTEKTTAGRLIKLGRTIDDNIAEFIEEYENKKLRNLKEKDIFYNKIKLWDAQIYTFVTLLEELKDRELKGNLESITEYKKFKNNVTGIQNAILPLESVLIIYNEEKKPFASKPIYEAKQSSAFKTYKSTENTRDTNNLLDVFTVALECYRLSNGQYPDNLEILVDEKYLDKLENDQWGKSPFYRKTSFDTYILKSAGRDRQLDSPDDITRKEPGFTHNKK